MEDGLHFPLKKRLKLKSLKKFEHIVAYGGFLIRFLIGLRSITMLDGAIKPDRKSG